MRISTGQIYESQSASYQRNYAKFLKTGEEVSSGVKLNTASDDPVGAARVLQLAHQNSMLEQYAANITTINYNTANSETALESVVVALQTVNELVVKAGNGAYTDADRISTAEELKQLQIQLLGLMNSQDANGRYLFSGSDAAQPPYSKNADGTYSYHGNQTAVGLPVGEGLVLTSNTTGWEAFDQAVNTTRTSVIPIGSTPVDDKFNMSGGIVSSTSNYNASFVDGQPYQLTIVSGPQYKITDFGGNDVTLEASTAGAFSFSNSANQSITFRGVDFALNLNLTPAEAVNAASAEAALGVVAGVGSRTYELNSTSPTISPIRSPGNTSAAVISAASVGTTPAERELFNNVFPTGGAIVKYTSAGYELHAAPLDSSKPPVAIGVGPGPVISAGGVNFTVSGTPNDGDQFIVQSSTHQTQSVLNTLSDIIKALNTPADGNAVAQQKLAASLNSAMGNVNMALEQASTARSAIGSRQVAATNQGITNDLVKGNNTVESQTFTKADEMEAATQLTLQKNMLAASQQVFLQLSSMNLFSKL